MSQSLERGLGVLAALAEGPCTLDQLASALDVHKSTAMRLVRTLESERFVRREGAHHYRLGSALFALAHQALEDLDIRAAARPHLVELGEVSGHTAHLATLEDDEAVYVDKVDGKHPVQMYSRIGRRAPLHCTAVGKALLALRPERQRVRCAERIAYPKLTATTIAAPEEFLAELERVRQRGYAVDAGEHEDFIHCLAAPVRDHRGASVAAVSVSVPKVLLDFDGLLGLVDHVLRGAENISVELGWQPNPGGGRTRVAGEPGWRANSVTRSEEREPPEAEPREAEAREATAPEEKP